ncbi:hypothetical protein [Psychrobacter sp. DAB_AL32B]|uniref:hypothetical protein n=1 Tax=Psychrobacter sp. DAB_AL32B TaxID=1028414 RepID=UPI000B7E5FD8|nr:hypothetical protein [Psychrobacter sp. DAB_AL32B]OXL19185.1 hypothetical protein CAN34_11525 [Psychrobacter sp. DAB_AL32B]
MRLGYYAHHHGSGHCRQIDKLAALLPVDAKRQLIVFTSLSLDDYAFSCLDEQQIIRLQAEDECADDVLKGRAGEHWQPASLHYSPVGNSNIQKRSHQILDTIYQHHIDLMIIDVSVEVAMLCRAASIPYLYIRLPGIRDDTPHLNAFAGALALLAPYPRLLEATMTPEWVGKKTLYLDFINTAQQKELTYREFIEILAKLNTSNLKDWEEDTSTIITVIKGYGGHEAIDMKLPELRRLLPSAFIISLGPINDNMRCHVDIAAQVNDVTPFIQHSDYLLMACGLNAVAQVYDYATPLVVLPDDRPHQEQEVMAQALIDQERALSWQQFKTLLSHKQTHTNPNGLSANKAQTKSTSKSSNVNRNKDCLTAAQEFMDSTAEYPTTKAWFEKWLLPKLELNPDY